jgi:HK97 family phage prohead protease
MSKWEIRSLGYEDAEVRAIGESRDISGYGIVFNKESCDLGGFTEVILPEAVNGVIERSDVLALMNHSIDKGVLARCTNGHGTMSLRVDERGVKYAFKAPRFALGEELLEGVERGDIRNSSFAFTVPKGGDKLERRSDGTYLRTVSQFDQLFDMSPCYMACYNDTTVVKRSLDELQAIDNPIQERSTKPVIDEPIIEPIVEFQKRVVDDTELQYRQYKQERNL